MINVEEMKVKILSILNEGPSLPVRIAKATGLEPMYASAILSELIKERKVRLSNMRVGSSPLYLLPGQEQKLEGFADNLNSIEKEAFLKLKDNRVLDDERQEPRIRVALRSIKDFAVQVQFKGKVYWKYFTVPDSKVSEAFGEPEVATGEKVIGQQLWEDIQKKTHLEEKEREFEVKKQRLLEMEEKLKRAMDELDKRSENVQKEIEQVEVKVEQAEKKAGKPKKISIGEKFWLEVKVYLDKQGIEVVEVLSLGKKESIAKVRKITAPENKYLLFAFDKKKLEERDLLKAYKKASSMNVGYQILCRGDLPRKLKEMIDAFKSLIEFGKIG